MPNGYRVVTIEATVGKASKFYLEKSSQPLLQLTSDSYPILGALLGAMLVDGEVEPELVGTTNVIKRIQAFGRGMAGLPLESPGNYVVSRIATQRTNAGDHLEVFLSVQPGADETAYNITDLSLQQVFLAAFQFTAAPPAPELAVYVTVEGTDVTSVRLGLPQPAGG